MGLVAFSGSAASRPQPEDCIEDGGQAICVGKVTRPWEYQLCDHAPSYSARSAAWCEVLHHNAQWNGPYARPPCEGTPVQLTEALLVSKAEEFTSRIDGCAASGRFRGWLSPGERISSVCWNGGPRYTDGIETSNLAEISVQCTDGDGGERIIAGRWRDFACPMGYSGFPCARFAEASCGVGNPIQPGQGNKQLTERDWGPVGPGALALTRSYNSHGYYRPRGSAERPTGGFGRYWRMTYDARLYPSDGYVAAQRPDGRIQYFDASGRALLAYGGAQAHLEALSGNQGWRYRGSDDALETYDAGGRLMSITRRGGHTLRLDYGLMPAEGGDADPDTLDRVVGPFGRMVAFFHDAQRRLVTVTAPDGSAYRYGYDTHDNLISVVFPDDTPDDDSDNPTRRYHYEDARFVHALTGITDENGVRYATYAYDDRGRAVSSEHAGGAGRVEISYHDDGSRTVTDALGSASTYRFDLVSGVVKPTSVTRACATCGAGGQASTYDANGFLASRTDFNDNLTTYEHNARGLEISRTEAAGTPNARTLRTEWHSEFRLPVRMHEPGKETAYSYDAEGRLLSRTETDTATGASRTWSHRYTPEGLLAATDGPRTDVADVTVYTYDADGNRVRITNALDQATDVTAHDALGRPLTVIDPNGLVTRLAYGPRGRLLTRDVGGAVTRFDYDGAGNLVRLDMPNGASLEYVYDAAHRLIAVVDGLGNRIDYTLDARGNRLKEEFSDPLGILTRTRSRVYDQLNRLVEEFGASGLSTVYRHDAEGNLTHTTDPNGHPTTYGYDTLNRMVRILDPLGKQTDHRYDARDNLTAVSDARGNITSYDYDGFGDQIEEKSPDRGRLVYRHDAAGNRIRRTDAREVTATYAFDALNRVTGTGYSDPNESVSYEYDQGENGIGRLTRISDASGTTEYTYDLRGNLLSEIRTVDGLEHRIDYRYDASDNLISLSYPSGRTVSYGRDSAGRIVEVTTTHNGQLQVLARDIQYLPFGPLKTLVFGNGLILNREYDADYRLSAQRTGRVQHLDFAFDPAANIIGISDGEDASRSQRFAYDELDRLVLATGAYGTRDYAYDSLGNRTQLTRDGMTDSYAIEPNSNRLTAIEGTDPRAFSYDAAGNTERAGALRFSYNATNRLAEATGANGERTTYAYNAHGERVKKTNGAGTRHYHYDQDGNLLAENDARGKVEREYVYLDGMRLAVIVPRPVGGAQAMRFTGTGHDANGPMSVSVDPDTHAVMVLDLPGLDSAEPVTPETWQTTDRRIRFRHKLAPRTHLNGVIRLDTDPPQANLVVRTRPRWTRYRLKAQPADGKYTATAKTGSAALELSVDISGRTLTVEEDGLPPRTFRPQRWWTWNTRFGRMIVLRYQASDYRVRALLRTARGKVSGRVDILDGPRTVTRYRLTQSPTSTSESEVGVYFIHNDHLGTPQVITDAKQSVVWEAVYEPFGKATVTTETIEN
ncbi:MAG: DUF6531 domain-containing protein, partial [Gammaproteobacteria bacterium]|nr:DUF6531 domain-containing protein [Gammaproteobacteria bacterium]